MEQQPSFEPAKSEVETARRTQVTIFLRRMSRVLLASFGGALVYTLMIGPRNLTGFSNGLFIAGAILLIIGLMPLIAELFGRSTVPFRLRDSDFEDVLEEERGRSQQGETVTFLFGISGIVVVLLSFIVSSFSLR